MYIAGGEGVDFVRGAQNKGEFFSLPKQFCFDRIPFGQACQTWTDLFLVASYM